MRDAFYHLLDPSNNHDKVYSLHLRPVPTGQYAVFSFHGRRGNKNLNRGVFEVFSTLREAEAYFFDQDSVRSGKSYRSSDPGTVWPYSGNPQWTTWTFADALAYAVAKGKVPAGAAAAATAMGAAPRPKTPHTRRGHAAMGPNGPVPRAGSAVNAAPPLTPKAAKPKPPRPVGPPPPPWMLACFSSVDASVRERLAQVLILAFPADADALRRACESPEPRPGVEWTRAIFARLPVDERKAVYRKGAAVLHDEALGDGDNMRRWIDAYKRFTTA